MAIIDRKPVNVLCLDGGGVRGLSSLLILDTLLQQLKTRSNLPTTPLACEVFDLICGTSTGGLIALMLGRLRMDIKDAISAYLQFSQDVFGKKVWIPWLHRLRGDAIYDAATLEQCVRKIVVAHTNHRDGEAPLEDPLGDADGRCRTFVVAVGKSYADTFPKLFRTYSTPSGAADECRIWEAARATTAASTFFDSIAIGTPPVEYIDGGLSGANNPSNLALDEIEQIFPGRPIGCFLSLGTGVPKIVTLNGGLAHIARSCARLLTSCETVENTVRKEFHKRKVEGERNPYYRFSVDRGLASITLDEWRRVGELSGITQGYMRYNEQEQRVKSCVTTLQQRIEDNNTEREEAAALL